MQKKRSPGQKLCLPTKVWTYLPTGPREHCNFPLLRRPSGQQSKQRYGYGTVLGSRIGLQKTQVNVKLLLRPNHMFDLKKENRFRILIQTYTFCVLLSGDSKASCRRIITGSHVRHTHIPGGQIFKNTT